MAESSGLIHVSVSATIERAECLTKAVMKSALFTADWQFHKPIGNIEEAVVDSEIACRLLALHCLRRDTDDFRVVMTVGI